MSRMLISDPPASASIATQYEQSRLSTSRRRDTERVLRGIRLTVISFSPGQGLASRQGRSDRVFQVSGLGRSVVHMMEGPVTASGALMFDTMNRVLLVEPTYKPGFEFPGGAAEGDESPRETCVREIREELGLDMGACPLKLLIADWISPRSDSRGGMRWLFDGGLITESVIARIRLPAAELRMFLFVPPDRAGDFLPPSRLRRLEAALAARRDGPAYLEDGSAPGNDHTGVG